MTGLSRYGRTVGARGRERKPLNLKGKVTVGGVDGLDAVSLLRHLLERINSSTGLPRSRLAKGPLSRPRSGRTQSAVLVLLLLVTLAITAVLTHQAQGAAKAHREAIETMLREYASFAAERYVQASSEAAYSMIYGSLAAQTERHYPDGVAPKITWNSSLPLLCGCDVLSEIRSSFRYSHRTGQIYVAGDSLPTGAAGWLRQAVQKYNAPLVAGWVFGIAENPETRRLFAYVAHIDAAEGPSEILGYVVGPEQIGKFLMPPDTFNVRIATVSRNTDVQTHRFALAVFGPDGEQITPWSTAPGKYMGSQPLSSFFGGFTVQAAITPESVPLLAGGEVPGSRLPLFVGLMVLTSMLIFAALVLLRRETELAQTRADFVSGVSHELRTPLAQIRMFTEMLLLGRVRNEAERRRSLEIIDQEARRLTHLVENVLQMSKKDRGVAQVAPTVMPLAPVIRETVERFSQLPRSRDVEFRLELEDRLVANIDAMALKHILDNLLDNAVKYGPAGQRVYVGLALFGGTARLWVDDEGTGIPVRERERIFESFYRGTVHVGSKVLGTGIGLAVVRELASLLQGSVRAESAPGGGARIVVEFPDAYLRAEEAAGGWAVA